MIKALRLTNYKAFGKFSLTDLSPFTLLGGANDVGKTSLLSAIYIYTARLQPAMQNLFFARSERHGDWAATYFHGFKPSPERPIEIAVTIDQIECRLAIDYLDAIQPQDLFAAPDAQSEILELPNQQPNPFHIATQLGLPSDQQTVRALRMRWYEALDCKADIYSILPPATTNKPQSSQYVRFSLPGRLLNSAFILPFMRGNTPLLAHSISKLMEAGSLNEFVGDVAKLFPHIKNLMPTTVTPGKVDVFADVGFPQPVPISELGDGVKQSLNILLPIPQLTDGILLCDEIAVGIHSSKLSDFVRQLAWTAKKYNCQIIATTHSYELLAAACEAFSGENLNPDDFAYIRMDRDSHGKIAATRFDHRSLGDAIAANWEVR